jgi:hypothetical protein
MMYTSPVPLDRALESRRVKTLLPTLARSREISRLPAEIRERALFSARTSHVGYLKAIDRQIDQLVTGEVDVSEARLALGRKLQSIGYKPTGAAGGLTDLGSIIRRDLVLETNRDFAWGYAQHTQSQEPEVLDQWPAQELIRVEARKEERDWPGIWSANGGNLYGGRMIALKNDPIWTSISRFGLPYPPFDFNSGMGLEDVDRAEAEQLGVLKPGAPPPSPEERPFNRQVESTVAAGLSPALLKEVLKAFGNAVKMRDGKLIMEAAA